MKRYLMALTLLIGAVSCDWIGNTPSFGDDFITYDIKAGNHEVERNLNTLFTASSMRFQALFDSSCIYKTNVPENQHDINKLYGFSDCSSQHQNNSASSTVFRIAARSTRTIAPASAGTGARVRYAFTHTYM